jgi:hypothetical protein
MNSLNPAHILVRFVLWMLGSHLKFSATDRSFQDMLNEYLPNSLLKEELIKRDYVLSTVQKDNKWKGGKIIVPFKAQGASSIKVGSLTASNDIAQSKYVRGSIDSYKEVWGSMIFNHTDLIQHDGKIKESTFLRVLPDTIEDFMEYMKHVVSVQLGTGPHFATAVDDTNRATGRIVVDRIDRFMLDQKVSLDDDDSAAIDLYVIAIDVSAGEVTLSATRGGAAADLTAYTVAQNAKFYHDGVSTASDIFTSMRSALLSAANGGSATLHGQSKLAYPFLQAVNIDGSSITASNIIEKIFDAYVDVRIKARGKATDVLMSYKNLANCMKKVELGKGDFKVKPDSEKASIYGWDEIVIMQVGTRKYLKFVGLQEWDDDIMVFMDWSAATFRTNGFMRKRTAPDGKQYYETRTTAGYAYILDMFLFGELEVKKPGQCAIIHSISY